MNRDLLVDVADQLRSIVERGEVEAVSVLVDLAPVGGVGGLAVVEAVAPLVARKLDAAAGGRRSFGRVLHIEKVAPMRYEVAVEVISPFSAVRLNAGAGSHR